VYHNTAQYLRKLQRLSNDQAAHAHNAPAESVALVKRHFM